MTAPFIAEAERAHLDATRWERHGVRYADDDAMQCMCGWDANGHPDRVDLYRAHVASIAVAAVVPILAEHFAQALMRNIHRQSVSEPYHCTHCGTPFPCQTLRVIREAATPTEGDQA